MQGLVLLSFLPFLESFGLVAPIPVDIRVLGAKFILLIPKSYKKIFSKESNKKILLGTYNMMTLTMSINKIFEENLQIAMQPFIFFFF